MYLKANAQKISTYDKFDCFPLLCTLCERNPSFNIEEFFKNPFTVYEIELNKMFSEGAYHKLCSLALVVMFDNELQEDWLMDETEMEIQSVIKNTCETCNLDRGISRLVLRDELETLIGTFLKRHNNVYSTLHDKLFDFLAYYCGKYIITSLIKNADSDFICERFFFWKQQESDPFIILVPEMYQQMYIDRLLKDWSKGEVVNVFSNINMESIHFRDLFICEIKTLNVTFQKHLANKVDDRFEDTVLIQSCLNGYIDYVKWCCSHHVDVNITGEANTSPLFIACQYYHPEIVNLLLDKKADINKCANDGASPLYVACQEGYTEMVNMLLDNKADINKCMNDGRSPLLIACHEGHTDLVNLLLDKKADINKCTDDGTSPLCIACQEGHTEIVNMLLDDNAEINRKKCHTEMEVALLNNKADINKCRNDGASHPFLACQGGHMPIVNMLLNNKTDINKCTDDGFSPLLAACAMRHTAIVNMLLNNKTDINKCTDDGLSPLLAACEMGHTQIVNILLNNKADIDTCSDDGVSPLFAACQEGHIPIVTMLLNKKADINKCTHNGVSPLFIACQEGYTKLLKMLLNNKADIKKCMNNGGSPLFIACQGGSYRNSNHFTRHQGRH